MKKILILSFATVLLMSSCSIFKGGTADKSFEGKIKYEITYPESSMPEAQQQRLPSNLTLYIKGNKVKSEMITGMFTRKTIKDAKEKKATTLLEIMGQKYAIEQTPEDIQKQIEEQGKPKVAITDETKEIAGRTCKKAIVTSEDGDEQNIYFSPDIGKASLNFDSPAYKQINGIPLEYQMKTNMFTMKLTAAEVEEIKVSDDTFAIPNDYQKVTQEELQNMLGQ